MPANIKAERPSPQWIAGMCEWLATASRLPMDEVIYYMAMIDFVEDHPGGYARFMRALDNLANRPTTAERKAAKLAPKSQPSSS